MSEWEYKTTIKYKKAIVIGLVGVFLVGSVSALLVGVVFIENVLRTKKKRGQFSPVAAEEIVEC